MTNDLFPDRMCAKLLGRTSKSPLSIFSRTSPLLYLARAESLSTIEEYVTGPLDKEKFLTSSQGYHIKSSQANHMTQLLGTAYEKKYFGWILCLRKHLEALLRRCHLRYNVFTYKFKTGICPFQHV